MKVFNKLVLYNTWREFKERNGKWWSTVAIDGKSYTCEVGKYELWVPELQMKILWFYDGTISSMRNRGVKRNTTVIRFDPKHRYRSGLSIATEYELFKILERYKLTPTIEEPVYFKNVISRMNYGVWACDCLGTYGFYLTNANKMPESGNYSYDNLISALKENEIRFGKFSTIDIRAEKDIINGYLVDLRSKRSMKLKKGVNLKDIFKKNFYYKENEKELIKKINALSQFPHKRRKENYQSYYLDNKYEKGSRDTLYRTNIISLPEDMSGMSVLDLGCNLGAFCIESYRRGAAKVMGVDSEQDYIDCARDLARYHGFRINYLKFDLKDYVAFISYIKRYFRKSIIDVVFALSLYKHLGNIMFDILKAMKWKVCYIESHNAKQGLNTHHVVALLEQMKSIKHCRITYLGKTTDRGERYLWKLEKTNYVDK